MNKKAMNPVVRVCRTVLIFAAVPIVVAGLLIWAAAIFGRAGIETMMKGGALRGKEKAKPALRQGGESGMERRITARGKKSPLALASALAAKVEGWY